MAETKIDYDAILKELKKFDIIDFKAYTSFPDAGTDDEKLQYIRNNANLEKLNGKLSYDAFKILSNFESPITIKDLSNEDLAKKAGYKNFKTFIADWSMPRGEKKDILEWKAKMSEAFGENNLPALTNRMMNEQIKQNREDMVPLWSKIAFGRLADMIRNPDNVTDSDMKKAAIKDIAQNYAEALFPAGKITKAAKFGKGIVGTGARLLENAVVPGVFSGVDYASGDKSAAEAGLETVIGTGINAITPTIIKRGINSVLTKLGEKPVFSKIDNIAPDLYDEAKDLITKSEKFPTGRKTGNEFTIADKLNQSWQEVEVDRAKQFKGVIDDIRAGKTPSVDVINKLSDEERAYAYELYKKMPVQNQNKFIEPSADFVKSQNDVARKLAIGEGLEQLGEQATNLLSNKLGTEWEKPRNILMNNVPYLSELQDDFNQEKELASIIKSGRTPRKPEDMSIEEFMRILKKYSKQI